MPETIENISRIVVPYDKISLILLRLLAGKLLFFPKAQCNWKIAIFSLADEVDRFHLMSKKAIST
jgi:hypothetical protein